MVPSIAMLYQYFNLGTQLKSFKYYLSTLIILFNITHLLAPTIQLNISDWFENSLNVKQFYLTRLGCVKLGIFIAKCLLVGIFIISHTLKE